MTYPKIGENFAPRVSFGEALKELSDEYPDLRVLDADVCTSSQTSIFRDAYPDKFYQMGIAEANMVGAAAGMATVGLMPLVSTFAVFLAKRALDQIRVSVAYPRLNVKINGSYGGLPTGKAGATHASVEDIAIMRAMPHMRVLVPGDSVETKIATKLTLDTPGPVYLRTVRCPVPTIFGESHKIEWGKAEILTEGQDLCLISTGMMTPKALKAALTLRKQGIKVRHLHMASIKPIDEDAIVKAARDCGQIITIENHSVIGGLGGAVSEVTATRSPCQVIRMGFPDIFMESGDNEEIFSKNGMNTEDIIESVKTAIGGEK